MTMNALPEAGGKPDKLPIPDSQKARAELLHNELVEAIAENDETLLDLYFEHGELDEYQMRDGLQASLLRREIFPLRSEEHTSELQSRGHHVCRLLLEQ